MRGMRGLLLPEDSENQPCERAQNRKKKERNFVAGKRSLEKAGCHVFAVRKAAHARGGERKKKVKDELFWKSLLLFLDAQARSPMALAIKMAAFVFASFFELPLASKEVPS